MPGGNMSWYGGITDVLSKGADIFLQREQNKIEIERQAAGIEGQRVLIETASKVSAEKNTSYTKNLIYVGAAIVGITLFVTVVKSI